MNRYGTCLCLFLVLILSSAVEGTTFTKPFVSPSTTINTDSSSTCIGTFIPGCNDQLQFLNVPTGKYQVVFRGGYFVNPPGLEEVRVEFTGSKSPIVIPDQYDGNADPNPNHEPIKFFTSPPTQSFDVTVSGQTVTLTNQPIPPSNARYSIQAEFATLTRIGNVPQLPTINAPNINLPCTGTQTQVTWSSFVSDLDTPLSSLTFTAVQEPPITTPLTISVVGFFVIISYPANTNINERIRYTVRDPEGNSATQVITFTVSGCAPPTGCGLVGGCPVSCPAGQGCIGSTTGGCGGTCQPITTGCGSFSNCQQFCQPGFICTGAFPNGCGGSCQFNPQGCGLVAGCNTFCPQGQTCVGSTTGGCGGTCQPITTGCGFLSNCQQQCPNGFICSGATSGGCGGNCQLNTQGCGFISGCGLLCPTGQTCVNSTLGACGGICQSTTQGCGFLSNCQQQCPNGFICSGATSGGCGGSCQFNTQGCGLVAGCQQSCPTGFVCAGSTTGGCGGACQPSNQGCGFVAGCSLLCSLGQTCANSVPGSCGGTCCFAPRWDVSPLPTETITPGQFFQLFDLDAFTTDPDTLDSGLTYTVSGQVLLTVFIDPLTHIVSVSYPPGLQSLDETLTFTVSDGGCGSATVTKRFIVSPGNTLGCGFLSNCQQLCPSGFTCSGATPGGCGGNCIPSTTGCGLIAGCQQQCSSGFNCVGSTAGGCGGTCQPALSGCGPIIGCQDQCATGFTCTGFAPNSCGGTCTQNNATTGCGALTSCQPQCAQGFVCSNFMPGGCGGVCIPMNTTVGCGALSTCQSPCSSGTTCVGFMPGGCGGTCMTTNSGCGSIAGCSVVCPSGFTCSGSQTNGCGGSCISINNTQGCGLVAGCGTTCAVGQTCVSYILGGCGGTCTGSNCTQPPMLSQIPDQINNCQQQLQTFDLDNFANDPDNTDDQLTFSVTGGSILLVSIDPTTHVVTITHPMNRDLSETLTFTVRDPCGNTDSRTATFSVRGCGSMIPPPPFFPPQYPMFPPPLFGPSECKISTGHGLLLDANCNRIPDIFETAQLQVAPQVEVSRQVVQEAIVKKVATAPRIRQLNFATAEDQTSKVLVLESRDARSGDSTVFPIKITNNGESTRAYQVFAEGTEPWGTYVMSEGSVLLIPPHQSRDLEMKVYAYKYASPGDNAFRLVVRSGEDEEKTDLKVHVLPSLESDVNPWIMNLLMAFSTLILISIVVILLQRKRFKPVKKAAKRVAKRRNR